MEDKTYTLNIRQTATYRYEVTIPKTGATKTAPTLESALTITLHDILKHLTTRSFILVFADQHVDRDDRNVDPQERPQSDLEHQVALEVAQLGIASQMKRESITWCSSCHARSRENKPPDSMRRRESSSRGTISKMSLKFSLMHTGGST